MANLKVMHKAAVISTDLTIKEIKRMESIDPTVLSYKDTEGNVVFSIATGKESVSKYGIVFENDSKISTLLNMDVVNRANLESQFGGILLKLSKIEEQVLEYLETFSEEVADLIEIVDETHEDVESEADYVEEEE